MKDKLGYIMKLQERIKKAKDIKRIPSKTAKDEVISWEDFFMSIAKLSKQDQENTTTIAKKQLSILLGE